MTEKEVSALMEELTGTLKDLGIPVSSKILPAVRVNSRAKRRLGCCYAKAGIFDPATIFLALSPWVFVFLPGCQG